MEQALSGGDLEAAREAQTKRQELEEKLEKLNAKAKQGGRRHHQTVGEDEIADVVSGWTKIPVKKLTEGEAARLKKLEATLHKRVIGQEEAVSAVAKAVRRGRVGLKAPKRPDRIVPFPGTDRRRQDRDIQGTGRSCLWTGAGNDPRRYV